MRLGEAQLYGVKIEWRANWLKAHFNVARLHSSNDEKKSWAESGQEDGQLRGKWHINGKEMIKKNKAGCTAIQSRTVGQEPKCKTARKFRNMSDGPTDGPTGHRRTDWQGKVLGHVSATKKKEIVFLVVSSGCDNGRREKERKEKIKGEREEKRKESKNEKRKTR